MLYQLFLKGNSKDATNWTQGRYLPANAEEMTLELALQVIRTAAEKDEIVSDNEVLSLFVGVDEYQKIPKGPNYNEEAEDQRTERQKTYLWQLLGAFQGTSNGAALLHVYPVFAGTRFGILSIAGSSVADVRRVPLRFLSPPEMEDAVRSRLPEKLKSTTFREALFKFGGIPRPCLEYAKGQSWSLPWDRIKSQWDLESRELLQLLAFVLSGETVLPKNKCCVRNLSWAALADQGMCVLDDDGDRSRVSVTVPYCVFRLAAGISTNVGDWSLAQECLVQNLKYLVQHVDDVLYASEPWQLWEKFGACFFAMKVNSFIMLGKTQLKFSELCRGAVCNGCQHLVSLVPMEVHEICEEFSVGVGEEVTVKKQNREINWLKGDVQKDNRVRYCLINGTSGKGLDVFAALDLVVDSSAQSAVDSTKQSPVLLYCDQRKVEAAPLGVKKATDLIKRATIKPKLPEASKCVCGLFSILTSFNGSEDDIPEDSFVLSYKQHREFYGRSLSYHPACRTYIDVNHDNKSTLALLKSIKDVGAVLERRKRRKFESKDDFLSFCKGINASLDKNEESRICGF